MAEDSPNERTLDWLALYESGEQTDIQLSNGAAADLFRKSNGSIPKAESAQQTLNFPSSGFFYAYKNDEDKPSVMVVHHTFTHLLASTSIRPHTSIYGFQGLDSNAKIIKVTADSFGLPVRCKTPKLEDDR